MHIRALHNTILFQFEDATNNKGEFESSHSSIWLKASFDESAKRPRWGIVTSAGPDCDDVQPGDRILIPALRWNIGVPFNGQKYWKTDDKQIVLRVRGDDVSIRNKFVLFTPQAAKADVCSGIIVMYAKQPDSPTGIVWGSAAPFPGEDVAEGLTIRYDDALFEDVFDHDGKSLSFIKQDNILCYDQSTI